MGPPAVEPEEPDTAEVCMHASQLRIVALPAIAHWQLTYDLLQELPWGSTAKVPPLLLPHTGVTWSEQVDGEPAKGSLTSQASAAKKAVFKGRESVSMYLEDANKTMQVVNALRERQVFRLIHLPWSVFAHTGLFLPTPLHLLAHLPHSNKGLLNTSSVDHVLCSMFIGLGMHRSAVVPDI